MSALAFSIVVPSYNEEADIRRTCDALVELTYVHKEVIVVDGASTDRTVCIVDEYVRKHGFTLIREAQRRGVSAARNTGIRRARGDVIVILNADVFPSKDFLDRIAAHYRRGAEYVCVDSQVVNTECLFPRFVQATHKHCFGDGKLVGWTEGFSCHREPAIRAGLFPEGIPGAGGEDVVFFDRLCRTGCRGVVDKSIVVPHVVPETLQGFWAQWTGRGNAVPFVRRYVRGMPLGRLFVNRVAAALVSLLRIVTVLPVAFKATALCKHSQYGYRDFFPFMATDVVCTLAHRYGEWKGMMEVFAKDYRGRMSG